ncbi:BQ5605_C001g00347 [Microbotryum silenes-dioicae]|uniref:BQ5605_C001g00347 protein n=1 Tax=Microbotryum silenes-dioicae TaxID=796604 RepID=A0A2X0M797_9BASI|nr:BQ5605_C001g00347 [Microbotryum silenes-dioicae]
MTTMQPILALRHVYEPAVQLCRTDSVVSAMANSTLGSPHHHLRKGECAGLESRSNPSSPTFSQGKLLQGSDSEAKAFRENARSYNNALSFTSLAAHWDQTQVGTLGPPVFHVFGRLYHRLGALIPAVNQCPAFAQTWLINPAEATDTRLEPDGADSHMQRSTLTKLESMLRTKNHFVREFASAKARAGWDTAKEWILRLCLRPGRDQRESRSTMVSNCASYLPVSVWMTKRMVMVNDEGQVKGSRSRWRVSRSTFFTTCQRRRVLLNPALHPTSLPGICDLRIEPTPHHDPRHQRLDPEPNRDITQRYQDAMACVVNHGKPPLLITMTYDSDSPETKAALGPIQHATVRISLHECLRPSPATSDMQAVSAMNIR